MGRKLFIQEEMNVSVKNKLFQARCGQMLTLGGVFDSKSAQDMTCHHISDEDPPKMASKPTAHSVKPLKPTTEICAPAAGRDKPAGRDKLPPGAPPESLSKRIELKLGSAAGKKKILIPTKFGWGTGKYPPQKQQFWTSVPAIPNQWLGPPTKPGKYAILDSIDKWCRTQIHHTRCNYSLVSNMYSYEGTPNLYVLNGLIITPNVFFECIYIYYTILCTLGMIHRKDMCNSIEPYKIGETKDCPLGLQLHSLTYF